LNFDGVACAIDFVEMGLSGDPLHVTYVFGLSGRFLCYLGKSHFGHLSWASPGR
jgi:hypothetical protein